MSECSTRTRTWFLSSGKTLTLGSVPRGKVLALGIETDLIAEGGVTVRIVGNPTRPMDQGNLDLGTVRETDQERDGVMGLTTLENMSLDLDEDRNGPTKLVGFAEDGDIYRDIVGYGTRSNNTSSDQVRVISI